jgi:hypothetical protein
LILHAVDELHHANHHFAPRIRRWRNGRPTRRDVLQPARFDENGASFGPAFAANEPLDQVVQERFDLKTRRRD